MESKSYENTQNINNESYQKLQNTKVDSNSDKSASEAVNLDSNNSNNSKDSKTASETTNINSKNINKTAHTDSKSAGHSVDSKEYSKNTKQSANSKKYYKEDSKVDCKIDSKSTKGRKRGIKSFFLTNACGIMCSRIFGFVRDALQASILGASVYSDIFFIAFKFPNMFRRVVSEGAFVQSFLPFFLSARSKGAFSVSIFFIFLFFLLILSALVMWAAPVITQLLALGFDADRIALATPLVRIHFWYLILIFVVTYLSTLLQYKSIFWVNAYNTVLLNVAMIAAMIFAKWQNMDMLECVYVLSYSVLIGGVLQIMLHFYPMYGAKIWLLQYIGVKSLHKWFNILRKGKVMESTGKDSIKLGNMESKIIDSNELQNLDSNKTKDSINLQNIELDSRKITESNMQDSKELQNLDSKENTESTQNMQQNFADYPHPHPPTIISHPPTLTGEKQRNSAAYFDNSATESKTKQNLDSIKNKQFIESTNLQNLDSNKTTESAIKDYKDHKNIESRFNKTNEIYNLDSREVIESNSQNMQDSKETQNLDSKKVIESTENKIDSTKTTESKTTSSPNFQNSQQNPKKTIQFIKAKYKFLTLLHDIKVFFKAFFPAMLGASSAQIIAIIDSSLVTLLPNSDGGVSVLNFANRIFQLPLAIFAIAISSALFPSIAKAIKNKEKTTALNTLKTAFWFLLVTLALCTLGGIMLRNEIVWLLFERGNFSRVDTIMVAYAFFGYMLGLLPFGLSRIFSLWLYSYKKQALAAKYSVISLLIGVSISLIFILYMRYFYNLESKGVLWELRYLIIALSGSIGGAFLLFLSIKEFGLNNFKSIISHKKYFAALVILLGVEFLILKLFKHFFSIS